MNEQECNIPDGQMCLNNTQCLDCHWNPFGQEEKHVPSELISLVGVQYVLQVDLLQHCWDDVQISGTLEIAQGDVDYWKRKTNKPVRIVRRTDEILAP